MATRTRPPHRLRQLLLLAAAALGLLQLYFALGIGLAAVLPVWSTAFMRAAQLRQLRAGAGWQHDWVDYDAISPWMKRAVVASEDSTFLDNGGVEWDAIREAWQRNHLRRNERRHKVAGGSTITQQLAKNLYFSPQRSYLRKGQELVVAEMINLLLSKHRTLELYLNSVEWGDGVWGVNAAAQTYFHEPAARLSPAQAARLAVMLPAPHYFQHHQGSPYLSGRSGMIASRAYQVKIPR